MPGGIYVFYVILCDLFFSQCNLIVQYAIVTAYIAQIGTFYQSMQFYAYMIENALKTL